MNIEQIIGSTEAEVVQKAEEFKKTLDSYRQPFREPPFQFGSKWYCYVKFYGLD
jgi:hypothetical protein